METPPPSPLRGQLCYDERNAVPSTYLHKSFRTSHFKGKPALGPYVDLRFWVYRSACFLAVEHGKHQDK